MWTLSKYAINSLLHFIDTFSEKGLEFVSKILSHSYLSIENHGKGNYCFEFSVKNCIDYLFSYFLLDSPYYYYYNESLEDVMCIKCSKHSLEYYNDHHQATSAIIM